MTAAWRSFEKLSLLVWVAMVVVYVVGLTMVPVIPHLGVDPPQSGGCYNGISKIGTPNFHCSETGFDGPAETLLTSAWLWVHFPVLLLAALLHGMFYPTAVAWIMATIGIISLLARRVIGRCKRR
jgi:hypothetical protein